MLAASDDISITVNPPPTVPVSSSGGGCFIATAAYETVMAEDVRYLRSFRDEYLLPTHAGRAFVQFYYRYSPPIADYIGEREYLRSLVRVGPTPLVALSKLLVDDPVPAPRQAKR